MPGQMLDACISIVLYCRKLRQPDRRQENDKMAKRITQKMAEKKVSQKRDNLTTYTTPQGNKGVYDTRKGPASSFRVIGRTWREVYEWAEGLA